MNGFGWAAIAVAFGSDICAVAIVELGSYYFGGAILVSWGVLMSLIFLKAAGESYTKGE